MFGNTILGKSTKQKLTVALSSTESELYAATQTVKEALWFRSWLFEVFNIMKPILLLCDNQATMKWCEHDTNHVQSKHIDIRMFFIREHIQNKSIIMKWIATNENEADILTKCMNTNNKQFNYLVSKNLVW